VEAYEELVRRNQTVALRAAALIAGADAPDAVQEAFVKAYAALGRFRGDAAFRPWLLRIVANEARNARRAGGRRGNVAVRLAAERGPGDAAPSPEATLLDQEDKQALYGALLRLAERDRLVLGYRFLLGLSERETAAALDIRPGTVKSRTARALGRLRVLFFEEASSSVDN
jgi:RNA polymerase sigma factor (sigma-70 family)